MSHYCCKKCGQRYDDCACPPLQSSEVVQVGEPVDKPSISPLILDTFKGDNEALCVSIKALLDIDATGGLSPNGIGGLARTLLSAAYHRLS